MTSLPLPSFAVPRPSASLPAPSLACPMPSLSWSAPSAASSVLPCSVENETKILSRKVRDDFVEAAARTSENTVREICPTM